MIYLKFALQYAHLFLNFLNIDGVSTICICFQRAFECGTTISIKNTLLYNTPMFELWNQQIEHLFETYVFPSFWGILRWHIFEAIDYTGTKSIVST